MNQKKTILYQGYIIISAVPQILKITLGKKIILIFQVFLICILLSLNIKCFAQTKNTIGQLTFDKLQNIIQSRNICEILYDSKKEAALVNIDCGSAYYINFKTKGIHKIVDAWPSVFSRWVDDNVAEVLSSCGTGCTQAVIFIAPSTVLTCNSHEYRIKGMAKDEPSLSSNRPLLIDPKKKIFLCYDANDNIQVSAIPIKASPGSSVQVNAFPKTRTIYPPPQNFVEAAAVKNNKLIILFENEQTGVQREIEYPL